MSKDIKRTLHLILVCVLFSFILTGCAGKRVLKEATVIPAEKENEYDFTYDDLKHRIIVCAPENIDDDTAVIVMLHGYGGTASAFKRETEMEKVANPRNYIVVYVTGAADKNDPTSAFGWNSSWNSKPDLVEKDDVGLLAAVVDYIQTEYSLKSDRAFVAGFSNGGFMTFRLAIEADDVFTACASVAGKMPYSMWQHVDNKKTAAFLQINGSADDVVPMRLNDSYKRAKDPAIEDVMEYFARVNKCDSVETVALSDKSTLTRYSSKKGREMWHVLIDEGRHSWPDESFAGFNTNEIILDFFDLYR